MLGLRVPEEAGERAKRALLSMSLLDKRWKIFHEGGFIIFPLLDRPESPVISGAEIVEFSPEKRVYVKERPFDLIRGRLSHLPPEVLNAIPPHWERYGHLLTLHLPEGSRPHFREIGEAYASVLGCDTVILDRGGVVGEYREPVAEAIYGSNTETTHVENGIRYTFDAARIMFSSGNVDERVRMAGIDCTGETVVDMFAGIGYFSLPIAKYTGARRVISIEKNPVAHEYLLRNIEQNGLQGIIEAHNMDNRDFDGEGIADRILMGYIGRTHLFLDKALSILRDSGTIHYHETCPDALLPERPVERLKDAAKRNGRSVEIIGMKRIKSYAPGVYHVVVDAAFSP